MLNNVESFYATKRLRVDRHSIICGLSITHSLEREKHWIPLAAIISQSSH